MALVDVRADDLATTAARLDAPAVVADVADPNKARRAVVEAAEALGGLDILVNNAGILLMAPLLEITVEDWDRTFAVNVRSMLCTIQAAVPLMREAGGGKIVNMASMGGKVGAPNQAHYAASKAAVIELTRVAAMELGALGITVNCICPGYVLTEMGAATRTPEMVAAWTAKSPLGRLASTRRRRRYGAVPGLRRRRLLHRPGHERDRRDDHALRASADRRERDPSGPAPTAPRAGGTASHATPRPGLLPDAPRAGSTSATSESTVRSDVSSSRPGMIERSATPSCR